MHDHDAEEDWYTRLIESGWEEQDDGNWTLPGEHDRALSFHAAVRAQMRREQWSV